MKKKGWPRSPRPAPKSAFGSRWLLFFTFILNFGKGALRHFVSACVSLVERRREKLTYWCLVCSSVDEKKNRRSKVLKMMQRRNKPIATPRGKGYKESKFSRHEEKPVVTRRKQYHETNERHDLKTWNLRHEDSRQKLEEQFSKRRSVCGSVKSKYPFCPRSDVIPRVSSITSRCSANEPALGLERVAEMERRYVWT